MILNSRWRHVKKYWTDLINLPSISDSDILLIRDGENWIFQWISFYLSHYLKIDYGISTDCDHQINQFIQKKVIQFIDRYAYLNQYTSLIHSSNHIFINWFHGDIKDNRPHVQKLFTQLKASIDSIEKVIISCSISQQTLLEFGIPATKLVKIPLGIDLNKFRSIPQLRMEMRHKLGMDDNAICIGSFQKDGIGWGEGREPKLEKGPDILLKVLAGLSCRYSHLHVLLTGPSRGYIKHGLDNLGISYTHHYLENYHDISNYYQALDLYLITARCEGGPASLLESWATGVPIVSTRVGMPADLIQSGVNGLLAPVEDADAIIQQAIVMLDSLTLRDRCRSQALLDIQKYDWQVIAEQYYQLYRPYFSFN